MNGDRLDDLDRRIIERLTRDARVSNRSIAAELGVTEGTIRTRIRRLQSEGLIQFTVVTDFKMAGSPNLVMFGITAEPSRVAALAQQLSQVRELNCVVVLLGRWSLLAMGLFSTVEQVNEVLSEQIKVLPGVIAVETSISVHNMKYEPGLARITPAEVPAPAEPEEV